MGLRLLLDSHALHWALTEPERLSDEANEAIVSPENEVFVSAVSLYELMFKVAIGKLSLAADLLAEAVAVGFELLALTPRHARHAGVLPLHHRDPFDRMLIAQAELEGLRVVTRDGRFDAYGVATLRA